MGFYNCVIGIIYDLACGCIFQNGNTVLTDSVLLLQQG